MSDILLDSEAGVRGGYFITLVTMRLSKMEVFDKNSANALVRMNAAIICEEHLRWYICRRMVPLRIEFDLTNIEFTHSYNARRISLHSLRK